MEGLLVKGWREKIICPAGQAEKKWGWLTRRSSDILFAFCRSNHLPGQRNRFPRGRVQVNNAGFVRMFVLQSSRPTFTASFFFFLSTLSKYCPAGCLTSVEKISGTVPNGYREASMSAAYRHTGTGDKMLSCLLLFGYMYPERRHEFTGLVASWATQCLKFVIASWDLLELHWVIFSVPSVHAFCGKSDGVLLPKMAATHASSGWG